MVLNLDPSSNTFDSKSLTISVGTNNRTGYTLTLSTPNDNTDLNRDSSNDSVVASISTLDSGTYTETTFTANRWGYKINSNTAIPSTVTTDYIPFQSGNTLMESSTAVNHDEAELAFAAKIDYLQASGSYATELNFDIVANPLFYYMQNMDPSVCVTTGPTLVVDSRDNQEYYVQRLVDGNCWMISNLLFTGTTGDPANTMTLNSTTSNVASNYTESNPRIIGYADQLSSTSYTAARLHSGTTPEGKPTVWYNYCAATAGTVCSDNTTATPFYDICPAGWQLPTRAEFGNITSEKDLFTITGGYYDTVLKSTNTARWWSKSYQATNSRWTPGYDATTNTIRTDFGLNNAYAGYIRCIAK